MRDSTRWRCLAPTLLVAVGLLLWAGTLNYTFFWEDPFDLGQVDNYTLAELLFAPVSNSYYRPVTLLFTRLLNADGGAYDPLPFRSAAVGLHIANGLLLWTLARLLFRDEARALLAGLLFLTFPVAFENVARAASTHTWFALPLLGALVLHAWGRRSGRGWATWAALALGIVAQLTHENGLLLPGFLISLEGWLWLTKRVERVDWRVLLSVLVAGAFTAVWLAIPKQNALGLAFDPLGALYLSQSLSYPISGPLALTALPPVGAALLGLALTLMVLAWAGRGDWLTLGLGLAWWAGALSLAWATRDLAYLYVSPRVMYLAGIGAALAWASVVAIVPARRWPGWALALVVCVVGGEAVFAQTRLYGAGSDLMRQAISAGSTAERALYINFPDRFALKRPLYPLGYWGMLLAPVSQDLSQFVAFSTGAEIESQSLADFLLLSGAVDASPYVVNARGEDAARTDRLYDAIGWADRVLLTQYAPGGQMTLMAVGDVLTEMAPDDAIAQFDTQATLTGVTLSPTAQNVTLTLNWHSLQAFAPEDGVFVHIVGPDGQLVAQADGHSLGGLLPISAWRPGDTIHDIRGAVRPAEALAGTYQMYVGVYNWASGARLPATDASGQPLPNDAAQVGTFDWP